MTDAPPPSPAEREAVKRYGALHLVRLFSLSFVIMGISIANGVLPAPYWLGVAFAVLGMIAFFFAPPLLVRRWKAKDRAQP